jgi:hypothetical protein
MGEAGCSKVRGRCNPDTGLRVFSADNEPPGSGK